MLWGCPHRAEARPLAVDAPLDRGERSVEPDRSAGLI